MLVVIRPIAPPGDVAVAESDAGGMAQEETADRHFWHRISFVGPEILMAAVPRRRFVEVDGNTVELDALDVAGFV